MTERQIADRRYFFLDSEAQYVALKATGAIKGTTGPSRAGMSRTKTNTTLKDGG